MATNVFDRFNQGAINLDGRDGTVDGGAADSYSLTLTVVPAQLEPNGAATATVRARKNGLPLAGQVVDLGSTNGAVAPVTASVTTGSNGDATFSIIGLTIGTATISASMTIGATGSTGGEILLEASIDSLLLEIGDEFLQEGTGTTGTTYTATSVVLTVATLSAPVDYNSTGYGRIVVSVESPLANALTGRVQRLSHAEQQRKHKDDQGLKWATYFESATVTIVPKVLQT